MNIQQPLDPDALDPEMVYFIVPQHLSPGDVTQHAGDGLFSRKLDDVRENWQVVVQQALTLMTEHVEETPQGFVMDEVEISLGFSAKGRLAFIAEAGTEASVRITYKRRAGTSQSIPSRGSG